MSVGAVVAAAGSGRRFGGRTPKALAPVAGAPLVAHALRALHASSQIRWIVVAAPAAHVPAMRRLAGRLRLNKIVAVVAGGANRSASVAAGIAALPPAARWILVHDGARPCVSAAVIRRAVQGVKRHGAIACGVPAPMTIKSVGPDRTVRQTLDRSRLWCVQTPQAFRRDWWVTSLAKAGKNLARFPDDAAILEQAGYAVRMVPGDPLNIKVTTKEDVIVANAILKGRRRAA